jgi:hypothetical protein
MKIPKLFFLAFIFYACFVPNFVLAHTDPYNTKALDSYSTPGWGCNSVDFWPIPGQSGLFLGRIMQDNGNPANDGSCSAASSALGIGTMTWNSTRDSLRFTRKILTPPVTLPEGKTITVSFDPSVVYYNSEYWVAWECHGVGFVGSSAACIGPLDLNGVINTSRTYVAITGDSYNNDGFYYSASVPKLFVHQTKIYLYWTAVKMIASEPHTWHYVTSRGVELEQENGSLKRLWPKGAGRKAVSSNDPLTVEVWGLGTDNRSNTLMDMYQVFEDGDYIYAVGGRGGNGGNSSPGESDYCIWPLGASRGCYRLSIARANTPLGYQIFNQNIIPDGVLPSNPQEYGHYWIRPDGTPEIIAHFFPANAAQQDANTISKDYAMNVYLHYYTVPGGIQSLFNPTISGRVTKSTGDGIAGVAIDLCWGNSAVTNASGHWSKTVDVGSGYCARISSGLPAGYTSIWGISNNVCYANYSSYEHQIAGLNNFVNCSSQYSASWDRASDGGVDYVVDYPITTTSTTITTTSTTTTTTTSSTTTSTVSTTTTTLLSCIMPGNHAPCDEVSLSEVVDAINQWALANLELGNVIDLINSWADPIGHPSY